MGVSREKRIFQRHNSWGIVPSSTNQTILPKTNSMLNGRSNSCTLPVVTEDSPDLQPLNWLLGGFSIDLENLDNGNSGNNSNNGNSNNKKAASINSKNKKTGENRADNKAKEGKSSISNAKKGGKNTRANPKNKAGCQNNDNKKMSDVNVDSGTIKKKMLQDGVGCASDYEKSRFYQNRNCSNIHTLEEENSEPLLPQLAYSRSFSVPSTPGRQKLSRKISLTNDEETISSHNLYNALNHNSNPTSSTNKRFKPFKVKTSKKTSKIKNETRRLSLNATKSTSPSLFIEKSAKDYTHISPAQSKLSSNNRTLSSDNVAHIRGLSSSTPIVATSTLPQCNNKFLPPSTTEKSQLAHASSLMNMSPPFFDLLGVSTSQQQDIMDMDLPFTSNSNENSNEDSMGLENNSNNDCVTSDSLKSTYLQLQQQKQQQQQFHANSSESLGLNLNLNQHKQTIFNDSSDIINTENNNRTFEQGLDILLSHSQNAEYTEEDYEDLVNEFSKTGSPLFDNTLSANIENLKLIQKQTNALQFKNNPSQLQTSTGVSTLSMLQLPSWMNSMGCNNDNNNHEIMSNSNNNAFLSSPQEHNESQIREELKDIMKGINLEKFEQSHFQSINQQFHNDNNVSLQQEVNKDKNMVYDNVNKHQFLLSRKEREMHHFHLIQRLKESQNNNNNNNNNNNCNNCNDDNSNNNEAMEVDGQPSYSFQNYVQSGTNTNGQENPLSSNSNGNIGNNNNSTSGSMDTISALNNLHANHKNPTNRELHLKNISALINSKSLYSVYNHSLNSHLPSQQQQQKQLNFSSDINCNSIMTPPLVTIMSTPPVSLCHTPPLPIFKTKNYLEYEKTQLEKHLNNGNISNNSNNNNSIQQATQQNIFSINDLHVQQSPYHRTTGSGKGVKKISLNNSTEDIGILKVNKTKKKSESNRASNRNNDPTKPILSFQHLITLAIRSTPERKITVSQIYEWVAQKFPYYAKLSEENSANPSKIKKTEGWK
eukprot:Awhi_evm1s167